MKPVPIESLEMEEGVLFYVMRVNMSSQELYDAVEFAKPGYSKVIIKIDNKIIKTHYFKNNKEVSIEEIIQEERMKVLKG